MNDLQAELEKRMAGAVRFDAVTRHLYSTDASMYQIEPLGVAFPKHEEDLLAAIEVAVKHGVPVLPRGGGTALAGQSVGRALILDLSTHMNRVLEVNLEEQWALVQPGVVQDQLNRHLAPLGWAFGPDTSTSNRATIGGMTGNNSCGSRSIVYGKTIDHVIAIDAVLSDGSAVTFGPLDEAGLAAKCKGDGLEGRIYRDVLRIADANRTEVLERYPKIMRRVSGYNLDELLKDGTPNLAKLLVGSEGTLAAFRKMRVKIVPLPKAKAVLVAQFEDMIQAVESDGLILSHGPSAMELVDRTIIEQALGSPMFKGKTDWLAGVPGAIVVVEFYGENRAELSSKLDKLEADLKRNRMGYAHVQALDAERQAQIWNVRKGGLGLLAGTRSEAKPLPFVEDTAVDPLKLPGYLKAFEAIVKKHGTTAGYYGHASVGCLHIRPFIDLKRPGEKDKLMAIFNDVADLVREYGGTISGEHGDGLARSWLIEKLFGAKLYNAFREVKAAFDPHGRMNPGKIVDAQGPLENLRYGVPTLPKPLELQLDFGRDGGFNFAIEMCNGNGQCRKLDVGTMCPSYQVTQSDIHSTRGRANALRAFIQGRLTPQELVGPELREVMELCLECKACKTECPSKVDMAKLKYEWLYHEQKANGVSLRARLFAGIETINRVGSALAPLSNWLLALPGAGWVSAALGIAPRRSLPPFALERFSAWFARSPAGNRAADDRPLVVLFHDTFLEYNTPALGRDAVEILERAGYRVVLVDKKCCGRPSISKGLLDQARVNAAHNIARLKPYAEAGVPIVGVEPSCILTLRDDYRDLLPGPDADRVAQHCLTIDEFLARLTREGKLAYPAAGGGSTLAAREFQVHGHCHQKALVGTAPTLEVLRAIPGARVSEIDAGCCGMAGSFGYEKEHYATSLAIGELRLFPAVRKAPTEAVIVADGMSCRQQIQHGAGRGARHLVEVVAQALRG
jgi:FAD/FMN-containing dehydrogenase/Fe-S oxidoreductase